MTAAMKKRMASDRRVHGVNSELLRRRAADDRPRPRCLTEAQGPTWPARLEPKASHDVTAAHVRADSHATESTSLIRALTGRQRICPCRYFLLRGIISTAISAQITLVTLDAPAQRS